MLSSVNNEYNPIIGINGMHIPDEEDELDIKDKANIHYIGAIQKSGGIPIVLPVLEELNIEIVKKQIEIIDGLLIEGGIDIFPSLYGEEPKPELEKTDIKTDNFIIELINQAKIKKMPILGICKGMQIINIAFGGTLYQDLKYAGLKSDSHRQLGDHRRDYYKHTINVEKNSFLNKIFPNKEKLNVNSYHHQAIKDLGKDLIIDAKSDDGIIEAIHWNNNSQWIFGVQWHPERQVIINDEFMPIFNAFIEQARIYKSNIKK